MSAAQSATISIHRAPAARGSWRTAVATIVAVTIGSLLIAGLMTVGILMSGPHQAWSAAPAPQPMPQPILEAGLDR
jgi:hypothetical protein